MLSVSRTSFKRGWESFRVFSVTFRNFKSDEIMGDFAFRRDFVFTAFSFQLS